MDCFVERSAPSHTGSLQPPGPRAATAAKMAAAMSAEDTAAPLPPSPALHLPKDTEATHAKIALAVAQLLTPMIAEAVDRAVQHGMEQLRLDIHSQTHKLQEAEQRIASVEEQLHQVTTSISTQAGVPQFLLDKLEDLENRSRRNNLRIIGPPESYRMTSLMKLYSHHIPEALGLCYPCVVELTHRIGPQQYQQSKPRPVIVHYLNYAEKHTLLQHYRKAKGLSIDGHKLLLFADYSVEVSKQRISFASVWS